MTVALIPPFDQEPPDAGTIPPQDIDAELAVLGSMLLSAHAIEDCERLEPTDFYRPAHEVILAAITELTTQGQPVDSITVADQLSKRGNLTRAGGHAYLHQLITSVPTAANASYYARIVIGESVKRRLIEAGTKVISDAYKAASDADPSEIIDAARATLDQLTNRGAVEPSVNPSDVYDAIDCIGEAAGIPTPWVALTDAIAGWRSGEMYVVAAGTGVGKTIVGVNAGLYAAQQGLPSLIFSFEMPRKQLYWRMLSQVGRVPMNRIVANTLDDHHHQKLQVAAGQISPLPLIVDDRSGATPSEIRAVVRSAQRQHGKLGLVVIDQASLVLTTGKFENREKEMAHIAERSRALAKDFDVPVVLLSQVNEEGKVRESKAVEHFASVVVTLERDKSTPETAVDMKFVIGKNRHGSETAFTLPFAGHYSCIYDEGGSAG